MLNLSFLGVPAIAHAGRAVEFSRRQPVALLALLALSPTAISRERLAFLLWEGVPQSLASQRLRRVLYCLRRGLEEAGAGDVLRVSPASVELVEERCWRDVRAFEQLASRAVGGRGEGAIAAAVEALELYRGPLLEGFVLEEAPEFEQWLLVERARMETLHRETLAALVEGYIATGQTERAIVAAQRLLAVDPLAEEVHVTLMRLYAARGQRAAALGQYRQCEETLSEEFDVAPMPATRALYRAIEQGGRAPGSVPAPEWPLRTALRPPFVGREAEMDELRQALLAGLSGQVVVACVHGTAGIGKSRLIQEAAGSLPAPLWLGRAQGARHALPFATLLGAARSALAYLPTGGDPLSHLSHLDLPAPWRREASRLLPELRGEGDSDSPPAPHEMTVLCEALARLLLALARASGGAILALDGLDEVDGATLACLSTLVEGQRRGRAPLALLVAYRRAARHLPLAAWLDDLRPREARREVALGPLPPRDVATLLEIDLELAGRLHEECGGNPFFLLESMSVLRAGPLALSRRLPVPFPLPEPVREAIERSLLALSPRTRRLAEACAILPPRFLFEHLCALSGRDEEEVALALGVLVEEGILAREGGWYRLAHGHLRRVLDQGMGEAWRHLLLRRAARMQEPRGLPLLPVAGWPAGVTAAV